MRTLLRPSAFGPVLPLVCALGIASHANAQEKEELLGSEFIDMPEDPKTAAPAEAPKDEKEAPGYVPGYRSVPSVGLSPHAPQLYSGLPGGVNPSLGAPQPGDQFRFDHHGYLQAPLRVGIGRRASATGQQKQLTLHGDPVLPGGSYGWFDHTQTVPTPWAQVNFYYGNQYVQATAIIGGWNLSRSMEAAGYFQPNARVLINDAFLTFTPPKFSQLDFKINVGAYNDRYGAMGEYDSGRYGVPLIAQIAGVGTTLTARWPLAEHSLALNFEYGFKGDLNTAPTGIAPDGSNEHAKELEGSTYTQHAHVGATLADIVEPTLHYITSWAQDDRGDPADDPETALNESFLKPDGRLTIYGADLRVKGGRHGYFYAGFSHTVGDNVLSLSDQTQVLYTGSGNLFMDRFWGYQSGGNGTVTVAGLEYTLSLGTLLRYPMEFWGEGPDLIVSLFGIGAHVTSEQAEFDNKDMIKYGTEVTYSIASWFAMSGRFDHVRPDLDNTSRSFAVFSPKLIFRTDWKTREAITLQYAGYLLGDDVRVEGDDRLFNNTSGDPDSHLIAIYGTMWW